MIRQLAVVRTQGCSHTQQEIELQGQAVVQLTALICIPFTGFKTKMHLCSLQFILFVSLRLHGLKYTQIHAFALNFHSLKELQLLAIMPTQYMHFEVNSKHA